MEDEKTKGFSGLLKDDQPNGEVRGRLPLVGDGHRNREINEDRFAGKA